MGKDYYNILGVSRTATKEELKKAFRQKAHKYHPDKKDGDEKQFKEINEAYQVLGNDEKRQQYDQFGSTFDQQGGFSGGMDWDDFMRHARQGGGGATYGNVDLNDIFSDIFGGFGFGGQRGGQRSTRGHDLEVDLHLGFKEAVFGIEKTIELEKMVICDKCNGNGAEPGTKISDCKECQGKGQVRKVQQTILGNMQTVVVCPHCQGEGKSYEKNCSQCAGQGRVKKKQQINIKVPAGIDHGMTLKMRSEGGAGLKGAKAGDLYIHIYVAPDKNLKRHDDNIISQLEINLSTAILGDKVPVETIDGEVNLKIPAGTQSGKVLILKGKGIPRFQRYGRGDHLVEINVKIPDKLTKDQKKIVNDLQEKGL